MLGFIFAFNRVFNQRDHTLPGTRVDELQGAQRHKVKDELGELFGFFKTVSLKHFCQTGQCFCTTGLPAERPVFFADLFFGLENLIKPCRHVLRRKL